MNTRPNLWIVGGQKCGTTALAHFLAQHPDIALAEGKEAHIFDHPDHLSPQGECQASSEALDALYASRFAHAQQQRYRCDATPIYAHWSQLIPAIAAYSPQSKVIMMLREPVQRAVSQYQMERSRGHEPRGILSAFLLEPWRLSRAQGDYSWASPLRTQSYLQRGEYRRQVAALQQTFAAPQVLVLTNEALRDHHQLTLARIFEFLQLPALPIAAEQVFAGQAQPSNIALSLAKLWARWRLKDEVVYWQQYHQHTLRWLHSNKDDPR